MTKSIFEGVKAIGGIQGVNADPGECIISGDDRDQASDPGRLLELWDEFFTSLTVAEIDALSKGTADAELKFEMLMLENSVIPESYFDQFRNPEGDP